MEGKPELESGGFDEKTIQTAGKYWNSLGRRLNYEFELAELPKRLLFLNPVLKAREVRNAKKLAKHLNLNFEDKTELVEEMPFIAGGILGLSREMVGDYLESAKSSSRDS